MLQYKTRQRTISSTSCSSNEETPIGIVNSVCNDFDGNGIFSVGAIGALRAMSHHWSCHLAEGRNPKIISEDIDEMAKQLEIMRAEIMRRILEQSMDRRPFRFTEDGVVVNGKHCFSIGVANDLFGDSLKNAENATNDRFEQYLMQSEAFGQVDAKKYESLVESFVNIICATAKPDEKPNINTAYIKRDALGNQCEGECIACVGCIGDGQQINAATTAMSAFRHEVAICIDCMLQDDSRGEAMVFVREGGCLIPKAISADAIDLDNLLQYEMILFDGGNSAGDTWKHTFFPKQLKHHFVDENPLPRNSTAANIMVSVDGGITYQPSPAGVRLIYKGVMIDGEDGRGEVHINATHEGLVTDIWIDGECDGPGTEPTDYNIGTESVLIEDIVSRLVKENE